jgi:hypothetical protein
MIDDDLDAEFWAEFDKCVNAMNRGARPRGYKSIIEKSNAQDFADALKEATGVEVTDVQSFPEESDARDVTGRLGEREITFQLAQLRAPVNGPLPPGRYIEWSREMFEEKVNSLIDKKDALYGSEPAVDILLLHADETWLTNERVGDWLASMTFAPRNAFRCAYLLLDNAPRSVHALYGDLRVEA